jgi:hypothetical protein
MLEARWESVWVHLQRVNLCPSRFVCRVLFLLVSFNSMKELQRDDKSSGRVLQMVVHVVRMAQGGIARTV